MGGFLFRSFSFFFEGEFRREGGREGVREREREMTSREMRDTAV